jgi:serine/threonine protein phosphatase PrpC
MNLKSYAVQSHSGPYLQLNEDLAEVDFLNGLYFIMDGYGGSGIGDKTVEFLSKKIKSFYTRIHGDPDSTLPFYFSHKYSIESNALINAAHFAHKSLVEENHGNAFDMRGGSSALMVAVSDNILGMVSTGNCRAYLFRKNGLTKIFEEDSHRNFFKEEHAAHFMSAPLSGFGLFEDIHLNATEIRVGEGDTVCMFTEGAYSRLTDEEIKYMLERKDFTPSDKIQNIFDLANERGNLINQTALILNF